MSLESTWHFGRCEGIVFPLICIGRFSSSYKMSLECSSVVSHSVKWQNLHRLISLNTHRTVPDFHKVWTVDNLLLIQLVFSLIIMWLLFNFVNVKNSGKKYAFPSRSLIEWNCGKVKVGKSKSTPRTSRNK